VILLDGAQLAGLAAVIAALAGLVAAIAQLVIAIRALHTQINGRMDELVASNRAAGLAQGIAQEHTRAATAAELGPPSAQLDASKRPPPI
jgi:hypothetical protein